MPALCQERHEQAQEDTLTEAMGATQSPTTKRRSVAGKSQDFPSLLSKLMVEDRSLKHMDSIGNIRPTVTRCRRSPTGSQLHCTSLL